MNDSLTSIYFTDKNNISVRDSLRMIGEQRSYKRQRAIEYVSKDVASFIRAFPELTLDQMYTQCALGHEGIVSHIEFRTIFADECKRYVMEKS